MMDETTFAQNFDFEKLRMKTNHCHTSYGQYSPWVVDIGEKLGCSNLRSLNNNDGKYTIGITAECTSCRGRFRFTIKKSRKPRKNEGKDLIPLVFKNFDVTWSVNNVSKKEGGEWIKFERCHCNKGINRLALIRLKADLLKIILFSSGEKSSFTNLQKRRFLAKYSARCSSSSA